MAAAQSLEGLRSGKYHDTKRLKLCCSLSQFPIEILSLAESLEILDLSGNPLSELPEDIKLLHRLKVAFFSDCSFTEFPQQLAQCPSLEMIAFKNNGMAKIPEDAFPPKLRWLILTNNLVDALPQSIGRCSELQKCMLAGNRLKNLPEEMESCKNLGLLRISANEMQQIPDWLFTLPNLSFLAFAGNPCAANATELNKESTEMDDGLGLDKIPWEQLEVKHLLGEGASGVISQGSWAVPSSIDLNPTDVAIKIFKGDVTSDGLPADEMAACLSAGAHPNLINPLGSIAAHPDNRRGLVLELIPPTYHNLGLPPTLQTCTRDVYTPGTVLTPKQVKKILLSIASAAAHLHKQGISHGDLYAHNILIDERGHALLGDLGAATIYGSLFRNAYLFERLEVLAFGLLIEDLSGLLTLRDYEDLRFRDMLRVIKWMCMNPVVVERPSFGAIKSTLEFLATDFPTLEK